MCFTSPPLLLAMDIFEMFFGGGGSRSRREKRTKDIIHQLTVRPAVDMMADLITCYVYFLSVKEF